MVDSVVIVGAGQAAAEFATALRAGGFKGRLTMIGDEPVLPYQRPPLSKDFLSGKTAQDKLLLRPETFWRGQDVTLELGAPVKAIDRTGGKARIAGGRDVPFDILVLATGARARFPALPGIELDGVHLLRRIEDVRRLRPPLDAARRLIIVGGGYIGLEVAAVARAEGRDVTVVEAEERLMKRVTSPPVSQFYLDLHKKRGVEIVFNARIEAIEGDGRANTVRLADGKRIAGDVVLLATGAQPNEELASDARLACDSGIMVDASARTADPRIFAIGDCARFPSARYGRRVRLECVQNAFDHGKAAAAAILGDGAPYDPVPWFWSDQYDVKFQSAGLSDGHEEARMVGDPGTPHFSVEYYRKGKLIAVDAINDGRAYMAGRRKIAQDTA